MIKAIIIDDEAQARKLLDNLVRENAPQVQVLELCSDLPNGVKAIRKLKPDLIFLDVEMPGHSGLELLDFFDEKEIDFGIIFTTAYNEYAVKAFKLSAVDYLLKPIAPEDLEQAIERFEKRFTANHAQSPVPTDEKAPNRIAIPVGQSIKFLDTDQIVFLKAENTYTEIHLSDHSKLVVSRSLKNFEETLQDHKQFFRCHKSYIVNQDYLLDYVKSDGGYLILKPNTEIPISPDKVEAFLSLATIVRR